MIARRLSLLVALASVSACGADVSVVGSPATNRCTEDSQCREGRCDRATSRCISSARTEVFFRVLPPDVRGGTNLVPTLTPLRSIRTGESVDLTLRTRRTVYGTVSAPRDGAPATSPTTIPASVLFRPSSMPALVPPVEAVAQVESPPPVSNDRTPYTWMVGLPEGSFDVTVRPAIALRGVIPPRFERSFDVRSDSTYQRFDIVYSGSYTRWSGVITSAAGAPVADLSVRAVDPRSHDAEVSTVSVSAGTGAAPGGFSVAMAPGAPLDWSLRITSNVNSHAGLVIDVPREVCAQLDATGRDVRVRLPTNSGLPMPNVRPGDPRCTDCVRVTASVEALSPNGSTRPLRGATVTLRTSIHTADTPLGPSSRAWFEDRVQSTADGSFTTWLVPGDYEVFIEPQTQDLANTVRHGFRVRSDAGAQAGQVFAVAPRIPVEGRVLTGSSAPLRGARVQAVPFFEAYPNHPCLADRDLRRLAPAANPANTTTSSDGSYRLDLDPGLYQLLIDPPSNSGFATTLARTVCVASRVRALDLVMDSPVEVRGVVRNPAGVMQEGAIVEAVLRVREDNAAGVAMRVARTTTGASGTYTLLLPSSSTVSP